MAISTRCCLNNVSPPPPALVDISSSTNNNNNKPSLLAWPTRARDIDDKWRKQCVNVVGVACCMIVGLQGAVGNGININESTAAIAATLPTDDGKKSSASRWSDKRMCPPWHANSLETIVPENLPRPSAHRRWEAIGNFSNNNNAPSPKVTITIRKSTKPCFSM